MKRFWLIILVFMSMPILVLASNNLKLWYSSPAEKWEEALPIGNSRMGAMIFGGEDTERIQLNDETFWAGGPYSNNNPNGLKHLPEIRQLIYGGKEDEAEKLIQEYYMTTHHGMSYLTLGSLKLNFSHNGEISDYKRELSISDAMAAVSYKAGDVNYERQMIASLPDGVILINLKGDREKSLNFTMTYDLPGEGSVNAKGSEMMVSVSGPDQEGIEGKLTAMCGIRVKTDGKVAKVKGSEALSVEDASYATLYIASATNYVKYDDVSGNPAKIVGNYEYDLETQPNQTYTIRKRNSKYF